MDLLMVNGVALACGHVILEIMYRGYGPVTVKLLQNKLFCKGILRKLMILNYPEVK